MSSLPPLAADPLAFRQALSQFAAGVTVVTTRSADGIPRGLTVTAFCSVSLEPPLVLVSVDNRSDAHAGFAAGAFAVSVLAEEQEDVSRRFAQSGPEKFAFGECVAGASGRCRWCGTRSPTWSAASSPRCRVVTTRSTWAWSRTRGWARAGRSCTTGEGIAGWRRSPEP
jgi:hypothetical protein